MSLWHLCLQEVQGCGEQGHYRDQPGETDRQMAIAAPLHAEHDVADGDEEDGEAIGDQVGEGGDRHRRDEGALGQIVMRVRPQRKPAERQHDQQRQQPTGVQPPRRRIDDPVLVAKQKAGAFAERLRSHRAHIAHHVLKRSLIAVFARVCASTILTITAQ